MTGRTNEARLGVVAALMAVVLVAAPAVADAGRDIGHTRPRASSCPLRLPASLPNPSIVVPILMYHRVDVVTPATPAASRPLTVHPDDFARQMRWLKREGYRTITQREL